MYVGKRKRHITVVYAGVEIVISIMSVGEEIRFRVIVCIKDMIAGGDLPFMSWEKLFLPRKGAATGRVDKNVFSLWALARADADEAIGAGAVEGACITLFMEANSI